MIDKELKKLDFKGKTLYYKVWYDVHEYGEDVWTEFYVTNTRVKFVKKYWLFGEIVPKPNNKKVFQLDYDIESARFTKSKVRASIAHKVELMGRKEELKKGEII